jgi:riboflavin kinase/FMN adenylyltransferase
LGYPTANLRIENEEKLIPGDGIYAVQVSIVNRESSIVNKNPGNSPFTIDHSRLKGMMSIGVRPTIGVSDRVIEVNIFDFNEGIYGATLIVHVKKYLRSEVKFDSLDALKEQLAKDKEETLKALI